MDETTRHLVIGAIIGAGLAWIIKWVIKFFLFQISNNYLKNKPELSKCNVKNYSN